MGTTECCAIIAPGLEQRDAQEVAAGFRALSDPTRVRLLNLLACNPELCVCELVGHFDLSQPTISHHLSILKKAGLVDSTERGRWAFYTANNEAIEALGKALEVTHV